MKASTVVLLSVLTLVGLFGFVWIVQGNEFFLYKVFAPQYEQVRRETFEQSKAYNQGMIQELQNMQFQYVAIDETNTEARAALASIILHRVADYDENKLPSDLASFVRQLKQQRTTSSYKG